MNTDLLYLIRFTSERRNDLLCPDELFLRTEVLILDPEMSILRAPHFSDDRSISGRVLEQDIRSLQTIIGDTRYRSLRELMLLDRAEPRAHRSPLALVNADTVRAKEQQIKEQARRIDDLCAIAEQRAHDIVRFTDRAAVVERHLVTENRRLLHELAQLQPWYRKVGRWFKSWWSGWTEDWKED